MEIWKEIVSIPGYVVSNLGRVKKLPCGWGVNSHEVIKKFHLSPEGYFIVNYRTKDGRQHSKPVHRIVAETFIPNPQRKETVNHIDGNKVNNCVENLEWATRSEQLYHAYKHNLRTPQKGCSSPNSKLTDDQIKWIRENYVCRSREFGRGALSRKFNVSYETIWNITENKTYKDEGSTTIPKGSRD